MIRFPGRIVPVLLFLSLAAGGCVQTNTTAGGAVGVEREQTMLVSAAEVNKSADAAYRKTLQQAQSAGRLNRDPAVVQRVRGIASRLTAAAGAFQARKGRGNAGRCAIDSTGNRPRRPRGTPRRTEQA